MPRVMIESEALRPVVQEYLDNYKTAEVPDSGRWKLVPLSPVSILAGEVGMPERMLRHLLAGTYQTIEFDRADKLLCAMGYGVMGWLVNEPLREAYYSADLAHYDRKRGVPKPTEERICEECGNDFSTQREIQRFCTDRCQRRAANRRLEKRRQAAACR